jgi:hypothetical protein
MQNTAPSLVLLNGLQCLSLKGWFPAFGPGNQFFGILF